MNLNEDEILRAANIAASKFGSADPAIDRDDFVSVATLRIIERDPTTVACAVHVGREALGRIVGQVRYTKEAITVRGSEVKPVDRLYRPTMSTAEHKKRRFARELIKSIGKPICFFSKFGVAYPENVEPKLAVAWFDSIESIDNSDKRRVLKIKGNITADVLALANDHYVCLLVPEHGKESNNATPTNLAKGLGQSTLQAACQACNGCQC